MDENVEAEAREDRVLELWVLVHDDGHDADVGQEAASSTYNVFPEKNQASSELFSKVRPIN